MQIQKASPTVKNTTLSVLCPNQRIESLKELLILEQQRAQLQIELDTVIRKITALQLSLFATSSKVFSSGTPFQHTSSALLHAPRARRMPRGELRRHMLEALRNAGKDGVEVRALSARLKIKSVNIHSWFHSAIKKHSQIRKLAPGRYLLEGDLHFPIPSPYQHASTSANEFSHRQIARSKRGEVSKQIFQILQQAGQTGVSVREISARIGSHYRNVHVWFSSTGKKNFKIERVSRGVYRLAPPTFHNVN